MQVSRRPHRFWAIVLLPLAADVLWADAVIFNQAMQAETIAQYYVEPEGIRLDLEIGLSGLAPFRNLLPSEIYQQITGETQPLDARLERFFSRDFPISADGEPLRGRVLAMEPRTRIERDVISGEPLPVSDEDVEMVIFAQIFYPFTDLPRTITLSKGELSDVGFVIYHGGVAVNDFRFLAAAQTLQLDWEDPWYSSFNNSALRRTYFAPMSGFIYVEPYEVRKEIIIRPKDLQEWVDLELEGRSTIPIEIQSELKRRAVEFLRHRQRVIIDGVAAEPELASVNFLERTLTASRVVDPPVELDINVATLGVIFSYRTVEPLPQKVSLEWDMFSGKVPLIPVASVDQAGSLPTYLDPEYTTLEWENYLRFPELPTLKAVPPPPGTVESLMLYLRWLLLAATALMIWRWWRGRSSTPAPAPGTVLALVISVGLTVLSFSLAQGARLSESAASSVVADLLHNVYRAFDYRAEGDIYDVLDRSVSGALLTDIYLETRRGLELENQGGARAKVKELDLTEMTVRSADREGFVADATWVVGGSVGHWGHLHERRNRYQAEVDVRPVDGAWKLVGMEIMQEERL